MAMDHDWAERTLCDDGACTGVIGGDGTCRVCGRPSPFWGDERRRGQQPIAAEDDDGDVAAPTDQGPGAGDDDRALCADGGCIGLIGADGRCNVCGLAGAELAPAPAMVTEAVASPPTGVDDRRLCEDGSCTGVLDARGVCNECGRSLAET